MTDPMRESRAAYFSRWGGEWITGWPSGCSIDDGHDILVSFGVGKRSDDVNVEMTKSIGGRLVWYRGMSR